MVRFLSISSGSSGNCYYIGNDDTAIAIDMGVGMRTLKSRLAAKGLDPSSISCILVTHDHIDHIKDLGAACRKLCVPVFATARLHDALGRHHCTRDSIGGCRRVIRNGFLYEHKGVGFLAFEVPHDATQTLGYYIDFFGETFVFMTDLGAVPEEAFVYCRQASHIIIESNYDTSMLLGGPYPEDLKKRIMNGYGHLSNEKCALALRRMLHPGLKSVFLCHLSQHNNTPEAAYGCMAGELEEVSPGFVDRVLLRCLPRTEASDLFLL